MKRTLFCVLALTLVAGSALAVQVANYGWEDGVSTDLGIYGNVGLHMNVDDFAHTGTHSLYLTEDPIGSTPQVYLAWIAGLNVGDQVTVSWYSYDDTPTTYPQSRMWGHYTSNDIDFYAGTASGNDVYTAGTGWEQQSWTFTFGVDGSPGVDATALCIEFRLYSGTVGEDYYWVDDLEVTAPDNALIFLPDEIPLADEELTWGDVKSLYR